MKFCQCPKYLWLYKNRKDLLPVGTDEQMEQMAENGLAVEEQAYRLYPDGVRVDNYSFSRGLEHTAKLIMDNGTTLFQASFSQDDLYAKSDIIDYDLRRGEWRIYEVKSSTKVKDEQVADIAFQKHCLIVSGLKVGACFIIRVNGEYVRAGDIDPAAFLAVEDVSEAVDAYRTRLPDEVDMMRSLIVEKAEHQVRIVKQCHDPHPCPFIGHCWRDVPEHSIYNVQLDAAAINGLLDQGIVDLHDVPPGLITGEKYRRYHQALLADRATIDRPAIRIFLDQLRYPLYFLDYETFSPGVPLFDGYRPYQRIVFQYSLHVLDGPGGEARHFAYLDDVPGDPTARLAANLAKLIGKEGSVIAWYKSFEAGCNREMGERRPEYAPFIADVNERLADLIEPFAQGHYVDKNFFGSVSLKNVLPALIPELSYDDLAIREGGTASASWARLFDEEIDQNEKAALKQDMLRYCERDTLAMAEIFKRLVVAASEEK